jgi:hypothetical protein
MATMNPQKCYVGDRAKIKGTPRCGEVMYVGPADFAAGATVVGLRLDQKRTTSMCDGKYKGERYFRCQAAYGQYVPIDDIEVLPYDPLYEEAKVKVATPPSRGGPGGGGPRRGPHCHSARASVVPIGTRMGWGRMTARPTPRRAARLARHRARRRRAGRQPADGAQR